MKAPIAIFNYQVVLNAEAQRAEVYVDGDIVDAATREILAEWYGDETSVSYKSFREELLGCGVRDVDVYINSYGGHVGDAMAIHDLIVDLNTSKGWNIDTHGRGMVCSSATYILMAGRRTSVSANTSMLIHNVSGYIGGTVAEIENYAGAMRRFNDMIVDFYTQRTGIARDTIADWMNRETWIVGQDIAALGFVQDCTGAVSFTNSIAPDKWPFSNMAVLNTYNAHSQSQNITDMELKKFGDELLHKIKEVFSNRQATTEQLQAAACNALATGLQPLTDAVAREVDARVAAAMNGEALTNAVSAAVANLLSGGVPDAIRHAIDTAVNGLVTSQQLEELKGDLANKIMTPAADRSKPARDSRWTYEHEGIGFGSEEE